jgi:hypothetical protein
VSTSRKQLDRIKEEVERAVATAMQTYPEARTMVFIPIIVECEQPKPRLPYKAWAIKQYSEASK